jgi:hypothetical protein
MIYQQNGPAALACLKSAHQTSCAGAYDNNIKLL